MPDTQTPSGVIYDQLVDAIRAELRAEVTQEVIDHLTKFREALGGYDQSYLDGVDDAITTAEELL